MPDNTQLDAAVFEIVVFKLREDATHEQLLEASGPVSDWVKRGLESARQRDPVEVLNDLELMTNVVRQWASADAKRAETLRAESLRQGGQTLPGRSQ